MIAINMEMPKSCIECEEKGIRFVNSCPLIFDGKADIERHPNCPLTEIVTCKDCIHRDEYGCRHGHPNCKDNFWCADGERRE